MKKGPDYYRRAHTHSYGARELKGEIQRNTVKGFFVCFSMLSMFFFLYFTVFSKTGAGPGPPLRPDKGIPTSIEITIYEKPTSIPVNTGVAIRVPGIKEVMGRFIPIPDPIITEDIADIASVENMHKARSVVGDGIDPFPHESPMNSIEANGHAEFNKTEDVPENPVSIFHVEKIPAYDLELLQSKVRYPSQAIKIGIEGVVLVRVLVNRKGDPVRTEIEYSDSALLEEAATEAVKKTIFTPAVQNGYNVDCWISIPIRFRLQ